MKIKDIIGENNFKTAQFEVGVDTWTKHIETDIPTTRVNLKVVCDSIDMVYIEGKAKKLKKNDISAVIQYEFAGMDRRTVSKARVYSQKFDAIMAYLASVGSLSVSIDRMVQIYQSHSNKVNKELNGGLDAFIKGTYLDKLPEAKSGLKRGYETPIEKDEPTDIFNRLGKLLYDVEAFVKGFSVDELKGCSEGMAKCKAIVDDELQSRFAGLPAVVNQ